MRKTHFLMMSLLLFIATLAQAQEKGGAKSPPPCISGPGIIELGSTYTFTSTGGGQCANCYDWDESTSIASISGSDQNSSVVISPTAVGTFTLDLTYFGEFGCRTCAKTITVIENSIDCENCGVNISVQGNTSTGQCTTATATLSGCDNPSSNPIVSVDWSWALAGTTSCGNPFPNTCPISTSDMFQASIQVPTNIVPNCLGGQFTPAFLKMYAVVTYQDGTVCGTAANPIVGNELIICEDNYESCSDTPGFNEPQNLTLSPNPASNGSTISFQGVDYKDIATIEVLDMAGNGRAGGTPLDQTFHIGNLTSGIYIVQFTSVTNEVVQKKLVIE